MLDPLIALLQSESCKPLLAGLRRRVERGEAFAGTLQLRKLSDAERKAVADLTGQICRGQTVSVDLAAFDRLICNTGRFKSLLQLVEAAVGGSIENKRATSQRQDEQWRELWEWARIRISNDPALLQWLDDLRKTGWLKARSRRDHQVAKEMLTTTFELLDRLPANGVPLPVFAACYLHDAHALDFDQDLGRLVCRGIAARKGRPVPLKRSDFRRTWELVGVVPDELSVTALCLNLPVVGGKLTDQVLRSHAQLGEPCRLTFRQLRLYPPTFSPANDSPLFVCENPSVVASAANRLSDKCPPLICVEGQPNLAVSQLLSLATSCGWCIYYHGDFDWGGIRIANWLYEQFQFTPWRFDVETYRAFTVHRRELNSARIEAVWDRELGSAMHRGGYIVEEEQVLECLLEDLESSL